MGTNGRTRRNADQGSRRFCWVLGTAHESGPWPGLVLEWRRTTEGEWQARVLYVPYLDHSTSVEGWFAASLLRPLEPALPSQASQDAARYEAAGGAG